MEKDNDILIDSMDERIESFLRGNMSAEEEEAFKKELKENSELRSHAMGMTALIKGLEAHESKKEQEVIDSVKPSAANITPQQKTHSRSFIWWACSAAAICIIFFSIFKAQRYRTLDETISPYYTQYDISALSRGEADSVTVTHLYSLFNQIPKQKSVTNIIKELEHIYTSLDSDYTYYPYANDIAWNLALAYIKDDQIDKAISVLEKLKDNNPDTPIFSKAEDLLKKLKNL
ncbi:MAG: hypothetical protein J5790_06690 [Bacteroidaceae bacterium]|nr:hypothetical protein [Bacteroidaceae bacterium]